MCVYVCVCVYVCAIVSTVKGIKIISQSENVYSNANFVRKIIYGTMLSETYVLLPIFQ